MNRFAASLFYVQRIDGSEHEGPFPLEHDRGAAPPSRRLDGGPVHQLPHHQALRRVPVLHKRNPVKKIKFKKIHRKRKKESNLMVQSNKKNLMKNLRRNVSQKNENCKF